MTKCSIKGNLASPGVLINNQFPILDSRNILSDLNIKSNYIAKEVVETKPPVRSKRKNSSLNSKSKRLKVDCEELIELKLTVVQAQQLMRPSPNDTPTVIVIEGCDFEEYEVPGFSVVYNYLNRCINYWCIWPLVAILNFLCYCIKTFQN